MRKLWIWLTILATTAVVIMWQWQPLTWIPDAFLPVAQTNLSSRQPAQDPIAVSVSSERLLADVKALSFIRHSDSERQQARDYIQQALAAAGWTTQIQTFDSGINLYANRAGTDSGAGSIVLGAHYDTVENSPGADDNATSVATVLEAARLLGAQPTARDLTLVFFDLEESGLFGSIAFVDQVVQKATTQAAVILDMIGYACEQAGCQSYPSMLPIQPPTDRGNFLAVLGDQGNAWVLNHFVQSEPNLPAVITLPIPTFGGLAPDLVRSDHAPFWKKGIGAVLVTDTANFRNPHYHQASDTLETIDPTFFVGSAQIVVDAVTHLLQQ
jgi:hypothetical protein